MNCNCPCGQKYGPLPQKPINRGDIQRQIQKVLDAMSPETKARLCESLLELTEHRLPATDA